jgi:hypothetical protein
MPAATSGQSEASGGGEEKKRRRTEEEETEAPVPADPETAVEDFCCQNRLCRREIAVARGCCASGDCMQRYRTQQKELKTLRKRARKGAEKQRGKAAKKQRRESPGLDTPAEGGSPGAPLGQAQGAGKISPRSTKATAPGAPALAQPSCGTLGQICVAIFPLAA